MLTQLSIRDIVLIEKLDLDFQKGLSVLTGETGAGKSILLDSLSLALGGRGDANLVRKGKEQGQVRAVFELSLSESIFSILDDEEIEHEDGMIFLKRVQKKDGRSKAYINDQLVSATFMRMIGHLLVEIHGQHDDRALVDPQTHRSLLDAYGGLQFETTQVKALFHKMRTTEKEVQAHKYHLEKMREEEDYLRSCIDELSKMAPEIGEETHLSEQRARMIEAEKAARDVNDAYSIVAGDHSPIPTLASLMRKLERKCDTDEHFLNASLAALSKALDALEDAGSCLEEALRETYFDPKEQEEIEERLFALRSLARKHQTVPDGLPELLISMADKIDVLEQDEDTLKNLEIAFEEAQKRYVEAALALSKKRQAIANHLAENVNAELPDLKLANAKFQIICEQNIDKPQEEGYDIIAFWVQTNPGTTPGPIMKVASGGELSRFLLALKVVLAEKGSAPTLIFDEIDTGVGGAVAGAIGKRLARLGSTVQVLAITHAPQVAARAHHHFFIQKSHHKEEQSTKTNVTSLKEEARQEEVARMLSGEEITQEARAAARKLFATP